MFREVIKKHREDKTRVCITLTSGKYVAGIIENHGPEALTVRVKKGTTLVMKQAIETISVAPEREPKQREA